MKLLMSIRRKLLVLVAGSTMLGVGPGFAEQNRLLPFWGQPFPSGFTHGLVASDPRPVCPHGWSGPHRHPDVRQTGRCFPVLHARD